METVAILKSYWKSGKLHFVGRGSTDAATLTTHGVSYSHVDSTAVLHGAGVSGTNVVINSANKRFMNYYLENSATSGDNRGMYLRHYLSGAGSSGEALRLFQTISDVACAGAHGAHISLNFGTTGSVVGLGMASRCTLHLPAGTMPTGTVAPVMSEVWFEADTSSPPPSNHSLFYGTVSGNATLQADFKNLFQLDVKVTGAASGTDDMVTIACADSPSDVEIRTRINGIDYWILATATTPSA